VPLLIVLVPRELKEKNILYLVKNEIVIAGICEGYGMVAYSIFTLVMAYGMMMGNTMSSVNIKDCI